MARKKSNIPHEHRKAIEIAKVAWKADDWADGIGYKNVRDSNGRVVLRIRTGENYRLVEAAPVMFDLLEWFVAASEAWDADADGVIVGLRQEAEELLTYIRKSQPVKRDTKEEEKK